eukprot:GEMP01021642.1.p1 GENE.GEMP01021642.1~~GEMP01021642.1.p1  ORF type:complete len:528 (+),score=70.17 GEMP01021642.1:80-1663(+)
MVDAFRDHENLTTRTYAMCDPTQVEFCIREDDVRTLLRDVEARNLDHLAKLCRLNQKFMEFENALAGKKFVHCSNVFCEMQEAVGALIGTAVEEPVLMNCRIQLLQWRQLFASRLEAHFNSTCYFHHKSHTATSTQSQTAELWSAFEVLNSIEDKARDLAAHTNTYILTPLAHTIRHLSRHHLDVEAFSLSWNTTVWTFTERAGDPPSPTESFLFILESFLNHVKEQWGQTPMQHYGPAVWEHAVTHLESFLGDANAGGAPPLVADAQRENHIDLCLAFELQLQGEHIITNLPLHHIVEQRRSGIEDREQILGEARQWMLVQDMCTMRVSHETEETALRVLDSELSSLFLPWCSISVNTKKLMDAVREQICTADPSKAEENQRLVWRYILQRLSIFGISLGCTAVRLQRIPAESLRPFCAPAAKLSGIAFLRHAGTPRKTAPGPFGCSGGPRRHGSSGNANKRDNTVAANHVFMSRGFASKVDGRNERSLMRQSDGTNAQVSSGTRVADEASAVFTELYAIAASPTR